jgi:hypothetical protein
MPTRNARVVIGTFLPHSMCQYEPNRNSASATRSGMRTYDARLGIGLTLLFLRRCISPSLAASHFSLIQRRRSTITVSAGLRASRIRLHFLLSRSLESEFQQQLAQSGSLDSRITSLRLTEQLSERDRSGIATYDGRLVIGLTLLRLRRSLSIPQMCPMIAAPPARPSGFRNNP